MHRTKGLLPVAAIMALAQAAAGHCGESAFETTGRDALRVTAPAMPTPAGTLGAWLWAIETSTGIGITVDAGTAQHVVASAGIGWRSPEAAIRALLAGREVLMRYAPAAGSSALALQQVWVLPENGSPAPLADTGDTAQLPASAAAVPPAPADALSAQGFGGEDRSVNLAEELADPDEGVRHQAMISAQAQGAAVPLDVLENMLRNDNSEILRRSALEALALHPDIGAQQLQRLLDDAAQDPSPLLREAAQAVAQAAALPSTVQSATADSPESSDDAGGVSEATD